MPKGRQSTEDTVQVNFRMETSLHNRLKIAADREDRQVSDMARVFLKRALRDVPDAPVSANPTISTDTAGSGAPATNGIQASKPVTQAVPVASKS